jgi:hypothetical protein
MKPAPFRYVPVGTIAQALELKAQHGDEARFLAGGQSLVPAMNFRLIQPTVVIDVNPIADLSGISRTESGHLVIGALTRYRTIERDRTCRAAGAVEGWGLPLGRAHAPQGIIMAVPRSFSFFTCANCGALYQVIRGEAGPESVNGEIACRSCGGSMPGRAGQSALKYFHLREAARRPLRERRPRRDEESAEHATNRNAAATALLR